MKKKIIFAQVAYGIKDIQFWGKEGSKWILSKVEFQKLMREIKAELKAIYDENYRQACLDSDRQEYKYQCHMANDPEFRIKDWYK